MKSDPILSRIGDRTFTHIIGIDEVGWGAIAGPIGLGIAVLPWDYDNSETKWKDSKKYSTEPARERAYKSICEAEVVWDVLFINLDDMAQYGPGKALRHKMCEAAQAMLELYPNALIVVDGKIPVPGIPEESQIALPKADTLVPAVSAASIVAKVGRDMLMRNLSKSYPDFEFDKNKGYPTPIHLTSLKTRGVTVVHRMNVAVVQRAFDDKGRYERSE